MQHSKSLYDLLFAIVKHVLSATDFEVITILSARLGNDATNNYMTELLELDEAYEVIDSGERKECDKEKDKARASRADAMQFQRRWSEERALVVAQTSKSQGKGAGATRGEEAARTGGVAQRGAHTRGLASARPARRTHLEEQQ